MRNLYLILLISLFATTTISAQVKIGDNPQNIDPASVLELESTDKVLVITRVTTAQMNAIVPSQGALCFNTDLQSVHYYDGTQWVNVGGGGTGGPLTADAIVNVQPTIVITPTATGDNLEVAPNSIRSEQIVDGGVNGVDIQDGSIGPGKLQDFSVTQEKLSENSVGAFALDNDNIGVSAFNNDAGYITAGDITSISADAGNAITAGSDGGAFYDDTNLLMDVMDNAADIAADNDQSAANEIQNPTLAGTLLGLTGTSGTVDLGPLISAGGSDDQNLEGATLDASNMLTIDIESGNSATVDLSSLAGGTADGSETIINDSPTIAVAGTGTTLDPYVLTGSGGADGSETIIDTSPTVAVAGTGTTLDPYVLTSSGGADGSETIIDATASTVGVTGVGTALSPYILTSAAADVTFAPTGNTASTDVQNAIVELQTDIDGITAGGEVNTASNQGAGGVGIVLPKNLADLPFKSINAGASGIISVTDDTAENEIEIDIVPATALPTPADQMLITNAAGAVDWAPAGHTGTSKSLFFADANGVPSQAFHPGNGNASLLWDYETRIVGGIAYGALGVGMDGAPINNEVKMHVVDNVIGGISYPLQIQNRSNSLNDATGIIFSVAGGSESHGKGVIAFQRTANRGVGDFHFLQDPDINFDNAGLNDKSFTIKSSKDIVLYGGIDIDGVGTGTNGQVLTSTGAGVQWAAGSGASALNDGNIFVGDASNTAASVAMSGDALINNTGAVTIQPNAIESGEILDGTIIAADLADMGASTNQILKWNGTVWAPAADDAVTPILNDGNIFVGDASNTATSVAMSGDAQIDNTGAVTIQPDAVENGMLDKANIPLSGFGAATADVSLGNNKITNLIDPTADQEAATKKYVDDNAAGHTGSAAGSVFFAGAGPGFAPTEDNANLFWDNANTRLGIGTNNPDRALEVNGEVMSTSFASAQGTAGQPAYSFHTGTDTDTGMFRAGVNQLGFSTDGTEALRIDANQNVGVGTASPTSTLQTGGSFSAAIITTSGGLALDASHHTIILGGNHNITLPAANTCTGRFYIIKNTTVASPTISSYIDSTGGTSTTIAAGGVIQLQSDGINWQQIN